MEFLLRLALIGVGGFLAYHTWRALDRGVLYDSDGESGLATALLGEPVHREDSPTAFWVSVTFEGFFGACCLVAAVLPSARMHALLDSLTR